MRKAIFAFLSMFVVMLINVNLSAQEKAMKDIHFKPKTGMGDVLPFYWNGQYHVFYQTGPPAGIKHVSWGHAVTKDFVNWKVLPYAILAGKNYDVPDGHGAYSGSVMEHDGTFHAYYTGHNPHNLKGGPEVTLHAVSKDLINWKKLDEEIVPDGKHYLSIKQRTPKQQKEAWPETNPNRERFRDPKVIWNPEEKLWWMVLSARDAKTKGFVQGLLTSKDLKTWKCEPPLKNLPSSDCPDVFKIGDWWYCVANNTYHRAKNARGPYERCGNGVLDTGMVFVPQRMFDGKRHIIAGHFASFKGKKDNGQVWGADGMCLSREIYAGKDGCLYMRPLKEIIDAFKTTAVDLKKKPKLEVSKGSWKYKGKTLVGTPNSHCSLDVPPNFLLQCKVKLDPNADLTVGFREQPGKDKAPYQLHIRPKSQVCETEVPKQKKPRKCILDVSKPITIQVFFLGNAIECFVDNKYAFSTRGYDFTKGRLSFDVTNGKAEIQSLKVKTLE